MISEANPLKLQIKSMSSAHSSIRSSIARSENYAPLLLSLINAKNSVEEGFTSLRKWTAKVDIFKKKYIVVPINEQYVPHKVVRSFQYSFSCSTHWYLAIIYHPEHVLLSPKPDLRRTARKAGPRESSNSATPVDDETISESSIVDKQPRYTASSSGEEVELSIGNFELNHGKQSMNTQ